MSIKTMSHVWQYATVGGSQLLVLLAMADFADDNGRNIYPSMMTLAGKSRLSESQVRRLVHELIAMGLVELMETGGWDGRRNRSNEYRIVIERVAELMEGGTSNLTPPSTDASTGTSNLTPPSSHQREGGTSMGATTVLAPMLEDPLLDPSLDPPLEEKNERMNEYAPTPENSFIHSPSTKIEFKESIELLTDPEVGLDEKGACDLAAKVNFELLERHVFAWLAERKSGGSFSMTGALIHRIKSKFSAPALTAEQKRSALYGRFHTAEYSGYLVGVGDRYADWSEAEIQAEIDRRDAEAAVERAAKLAKQEAQP